MRECTSFSHSTTAALPILTEKLKIAAGGYTGRAYLRRLQIAVQIAAVAASPYNLLFPLKNTILLHICRELSISLLMLPLGYNYRFERLCNPSEALLASYTGKSGIHLSVFIALTVSRSYEIIIGTAYNTGRKAPGNLHLAPVEELEEPLRMLPLVIGRFFKYICYLYESFITRTS